MTIVEEVNRAQEQLTRAEQNFKYADRDYIEIAIMELIAAGTRLDLLYRLAKKEAV